MRKPDFISLSGLSLIFGTCLLILLMGAFQFLSLPFWLVYIYPLLILLSFRKIKKIIFNKTVNFESWIILSVIIIIALIQSYPLFYGGNIDSSGIHFPSIHDNLWNIAILRSLLRSFPPVHPSFAPELLINHHYLYLYFLSIINKITAVGVYDLYFRLGPVYVSVLFGLSLYLFSGIFIVNPYFRILSVFFGVTSGNLGYLAPLFFKNTRWWQGNIFFADQPFDQIFNPYTVLGFAVFLASIYTFWLFIKSAKISFPLIFITSILIAASYGIKSFAGVILVFSLTLISFFTLVFKKSSRLIYLWLSVIIFFLPVFLLISKPGTVSPLFIPGWLLTEMMIGSDKLNQPVFIDKENYYIAIGNYFGLAKIRIVELTIYFIGNLGIRLLGFIYLFRELLSKKTDKGLLLAYCMLLILTSLSVPLLFNLSGSPYNIIQFTPFSLILLAFFTIVFLDRFYLKYISGKLKNIFYILLFLAVLSALPVNFNNFISSTAKPKGETLSKNELINLNYLNSLNDGGIVLINPQQYKISPIYVPGISGHPVYLADAGYAVQTGFNPEKRIREVEDFFKTGMKNSRFLQKNDISYIYLLNEGASFNNLDNMEYNQFYTVLKKNGSSILLEVKK